MDAQIDALIQREKKRQQDVLEMIPSENYASKAVRDAVGSVFINKYAEGQVGKRYYQGNANADAVEKLCKQRAIEAFGLDESQWGVNVQALSGSPANLAVYNGVLSLGDKIMAMFLPDGGHLSHGWQLPEKKVTLVSKLYDIVFYHVDEKTKVFDYDAIEEQAKKEQPKLLISGGTAYAREIDHARMGAIAHSISALYMADIAHEAGLVAAGAQSSPFPYTDIVTMTTHKTLRGPRGAMIFAKKELMSSIDTSVFPGMQGGPHLHTIAGIAVALGEVMTPEFKAYAKQVVKNAQVLADEFVKAGYDVVSGGTDKHLVLLDMRKTGHNAWIAAWALEYAGIVVNRNTVPYDTGSSVYPSGIRMGTPAITSRGMKEAEMKKIAAWIHTVCTHIKDKALPQDKDERKAYIPKLHKEFATDPVLASISAEVREMCQKFPTP